MISKLNGIDSIRNIKIDQKKMKIFFALILSNVFFFILFSSKGDGESLPSLPLGRVEVKLAGISHTPFEAGKKILLIQKSSRLKLEGFFVSENEHFFHVSVKDTEAHHLFKHESWEIIPYLPNLTFSQNIRGENHEILY